MQVINVNDVVKLLRLLPVWLSCSRFLLLALFRRTLPQTHRSRSRLRRRRSPRDGLGEEVAASYLTF